MKLYEALDLMAQLMIEYGQVNKEALSRYSPRPEGPPSVSMQQVTKQLQHLDQAISALAESCAADPLLFPYMTCWKIEITGQGDSLTTPSIGEDVGRSGGLLHSVRAALTDQSLVVAEDGTGAGRWDLSVACDDIDAALVCHVLHARFAGAIRAGILTVRRRFWRWRFRQLQNHAAAELYLRSRAPKAS